ncbi:MAG: LysM peptidoglycan-binding domain-containing protein [Bacteroidota bacterium]
MSRALVLGLFLVAACAPQPGPTPVPAAVLRPYETLTPAAVDSGLEAMVTAQMPLASPTPFTYAVQAGDTMGGIALKFGVALKDLEAANPGILPNTMSIGQVLHIPSDPENPSGEPTPTPAAFQVERIDCHPSADQGMWCFVLAHNESAGLLENLSAQVTLVDADGRILASQPALLLLNILPPGTSLPLGVYFAPVIPEQARPQVQILTAIQPGASDARYLPAVLQNVLIQVDWDGRAATVNGTAALPAESKAAASVWVAATAYDDAGRVVGWRRWEGGPLEPGASLPFTFTVSSLAGAIARVELAIEARP